MHAANPVSDPADAPPDPSTTRLLMEDVVLAAGLIRKNDCPFSRRAYARAARDYLEAATAIARKIARHLALSRAFKRKRIDELALPHFYEWRGELHADGTLRRDTTLPPLEHRMAFVLRHLAASLGENPEALLAQHGWLSVRRCLNLHHRLTHPRHREDLTLRDSDLRDIDNAVAWFNDTLADLHEIGQQRGLFRGPINAAGQRKRA